MKTTLLGVGTLMMLIGAGSTACNETTKIEYFRPLMPDIPTVITYSPDNITANTAGMGGLISSDGGGNITVRGVSIYEVGGSVLPGSAPAPPFNETRYSDLTSDNNFSIFITDLKPDATYHYRAFAENEAGTAYGDMKIIVTSYGTVSDWEGNQYQTVRIGDQIWMRENLRTGRYADGTSIRENIDSAINYTFGRHYSWQAVNAAGFHPGINNDVCPDGWHLPGDAEWQKLLIYSGISADQVKSFGQIGDGEAIDFKDPGVNYWKDKKITNSTGFSVLPSGVYSAGEKSDDLQAAFWTSTPYIYYGFKSGSEKIVRGNNPSGDAGFSVRCVKN